MWGERRLGVCVHVRVLEGREEVKWHFRENETVQEASHQIKDANRAHSKIQKGFNVSTIL